MSINFPVMFGNLFSHLGPRVLVLFSLFSGVLGDCGPPPVLKYAKPYDPIKSSYKPEESVAYTCLPGYREDHSKPYISICSPDKGWKPLEEFCERGCESPREARFSVVEEFLFFYPVGQVVHHVCHRSADHIPGRPERPAITCFSNYTWSSVPVFCKGQSCGDPGKPENGDRIILMDFLLKAKVNFSCNKGYKLIGSPTSQCLSRSLSNNTVVWKPEPPICFRPTCPSPPEIKNGTYTGGKNGTFPLNSNVTYICDLGFSLSGSDLLHCITEDNKTGIWRGSAPECKGNCSSPVLPPHFSVRGGDLNDNYPVGTVLRLQCVPGYENIPPIIPRLTCRDTSEWSELLTLCQGKQCPVPYIENGKLLSSVDLRLGEEITLGCDHGFRIIGGTTRRCILKSDKVAWDRELPFCERIPCARPPVIANGRYDHNPSDTYDAGTIIIYQCDPDYSLIGNTTITCIVAENGVDGKWDWPSPECKQVKCNRPRIPNGKVASVFQATYTYQNKLLIECNSGYTLVGASLIECDADSQWKPSGSWCDKTTIVPTTTTQATPKDEPGSGHTIGIAFGAVFAVLFLAALIFAAVKWFCLQGKGNTHPASPDNYRVVSEKDMALEEK